MPKAKSLDGQNSWTYPLARDRQQDLQEGRKVWNRTEKAVTTVPGSGLTQTAKEQPHEEPL